MASSIRAMKNQKQSRGETGLGIVPWHEEGVAGGECQETRCVRGGGWWKRCMYGNRVLPNQRSIGQCE